MIGQELIDLSLPGGVNIAEQNILLGCQTQGNFVAADKGAENGFEAEITLVLDTAIGNI